MSAATDSETFERALLNLLVPACRQPTPRVSVALKKRFLKGRGSSDSRTRSTDALPQPARICVLEVRTGHTLTICWSDSRTGHYAEQVWRVGLAREDAVCALSNQPIVRGDQVYRPCRNRNQAPANWERMILASAISSDHDAFPSQAQIGEPASDDLGNIG
ncbi:DUF3331 domain-containing protein [Paraburkholderia sp. SIMBA_054]|uniref:DUF3331 domain-containing protein n=1 Tax=Paraburkholderia sp. SIMBA_054 TaxID=3085795 RepID=UPI003979BBD5